MAGQRPVDAYVCYGVEDAGWVRVLAGRLFEADLEVFLDPWHADAPDGSDLLALRLAQGSARARCTILVLGPSTHPWVLAHYQNLAARTGTGQPRCVIALHGDTGTPPFPASQIDFRDAGAYLDRVRDLIQAIGPPPDRARSGAGAGSPSADPTDAGLVRSRSALLTVGLEQVTCVLAHGAVAAESTAAVTVDGHRFSALMWNQQRHESEALRAIGSALGATFTPDPVGRALEDAADEAYALGATVRVGVAADGDLADLPWETLILPGHSEPLALHPATRVYRACDGLASPHDDTTGGDVDSEAGADAGVGVAVPGPLRILIVVASPDSGSILDHERELAAIMDAVEPARRHHGAYVRILNEATLSAVGEAVAEEGFHVLHIACHARPGALLLEDAHGRPHEVTPRRLAEMLPTGLAAPLVVLSGPWTTPTATGTEALSGLARSLLSAGVTQVIAMTAPVTDRYATALCAGMYRELSLAMVPDVLTALAHARRTAETQRQIEVATTGRSAPAEWATPALYLRGPAAPLYDPASTVHPHPPSASSTAAATEFVGRRSDLRRVLTALRQADSPGVLLHGIAGAGKSALAAEAVRRLGREAGTVVCRSGRVSAEDLASAIDLTTGTPVLLLIDSLEANLVRTGTGSAAYGLADEDLAALLARWASGAVPGRLVLTSRHPFELPGGAHRRLWNHHVGPLSWPEARKLIWQLPALDTLSLTDQHRSYVDVGGHPRSLEVLDALLRRPGTGFAEVRKRMERVLRDRKIDRPELWMAHIGKQGVDASLAEAVTAAVHPSLLADLLASGDPPR